MKYKTLAYSLDAIQKQGRINLFFKGAFYCKPANQKGFWVFPWNVQNIELSGDDSFPVYLWGLKGKQMLSNGDISRDVKTWYADDKWKQALKSTLSEISTDAIVHQVQCTLPVNLPQLDVFLQQKVHVNPIDLTSLTEVNIPQSICEIVKK